jgi:hypothetical protein
VCGGESSAPGVDQGRQHRSAVSIDDHLRCLDHRLEPERSGGELQPSLELVEHVDEGGHLLDGRDLGQRDEEPVGQTARLPNERREKDVERSQAPRMQLGRHRLDANPDERRQRIVTHCLRDRSSAGPGVTIFLGVGSNAIPILVVDPEILDRLALKLVADALVDRLGELPASLIVGRQADRVRQRAWVGRVLVHGPAGELAELGDGVGSEELRATVDDVDGLPGPGLAGVSLREASVDRLQARDDGREIRR